MKRHPNFQKIDLLQLEIKRLSDEVAGPLLDMYFAIADEIGTRPNAAQFARDQGVTQGWLSKRLNDDPRHEELRSRLLGLTK